MKTAIDLLKLIAFALFMVWLCSACNGRHQQIRMLHDYGDSIGITKLWIDYTQQQRDSLYMDFTTRYPAKAFARADTGARNACAREEHAAYLQLLKQQAVCDSLATHYLDNLNRFHLFVDSLKLEVQ